MENNKTHKTKVKEFLGYDVRTVRVDNEHEYIVCKDMFDVLGLVKENGDWNNSKNKMLRFLDGIGEKESYQTLGVLLKQGKSKVVKEIDCLNIEVAPTVLTQFKPTQRRGEEALNRWFDFMKFVNVLLKYHDLHKYIVIDKQDQRDKMASVQDNGGEPIIANQMVNKIMGKLITGEDNFSIKKDELKIYQPQTTRDLLKVRKDVLNMFDVIYGVCKSHKQTYDTVLDMALKKYLK
jgi:hypothetical protein